VGAGSIAGLALAGGVPSALGELDDFFAPPPQRVPGGPEQWKTGLCSLCPAACGLRVRLIGDRAVHIQGNSLHPINQGGLCPKGIAGLQALYHPDRLRRPARNIGTREKPEWKAISWDEAMALMTARLRDLRGSGRAHTVAVLDRRRRDLRGRLFREFLRAYGSANYLRLSSGSDALQTAVFLQQGISQLPAYDLENSRYVLSFGVDLLEGWSSPVSIMRAFGRWRDPDSGRSTKFVQAESRLSPTAAHADEWLALRPGTEATLALGIAYVLITERLFDADFVREHTFGFEDWKDAAGNTRMGFRTLVLGEYGLNRVAETTGLAPEVILRVAREFARHRPAIAIGDAQNSRLAGDPYGAMAVHSLNALVGSIDVPGGVLVPPDEKPESGKPAPSHPAIDSTAAAHPLSGYDLSALAASIASRQPYGLEMLILHEVDPLFTEPARDAFQRAFQAVPFIVSFSTFANESSAAAGSTRSAPDSFAYRVEAVAAPVVKPRYDSRDPADVVLAIAAALGGEVAAALPHADFQQYLRREVDGIFAAETGAVFAPAVEQAWDRLLQASGWWAPTFSTADELWAQMQEKGGWWEPTYYFGEWQRVCRTPSGRFEFFSQSLRDWADSHPAFAPANGLAPGNDVLCLPHQRKLPEASADYPLLLIPVEVLPFVGAEGAHLPYLQQIAGEHLYAHWESWLEVNPQTAARLGIANGDKIWVESRRGRVPATARLYGGARPGVVHLPLGLGQSQGPDWARRGANPLAIVEALPEPVAGIARTGDTFVRIYRS
jgi:anaerobic selenocysteine-containing dehydrogenase